MEFDHYEEVPPSVVDKLGIKVQASGPRLECGTSGESVADALVGT